MDDDALRHSEPQPTLTSSGTEGMQRDTEHGRRSSTQQPRERSCSSGAIFSVLMSLSYIMAWVANGEVLQSLSNGSLAAYLFDSSSSDKSDLAYNQPVFITWYSYNALILAWCIVLWCLSSDRRLDKKTNVLSLGGAARFIAFEWSGRLGLLRAVGTCTVIAYLMQLLNITYIIGLKCISVGLATAMFQLRTAFVVFLSVVFLGDRFSLFQASGIAVSAIGIGLVVVPPVLEDSRSGSEDTTHDLCPHVSIFRHTVRPMFIGVLSLLVSALATSLYYISWRVFADMRDDSTEEESDRTSLRSKSSSLSSLASEIADEARNSVVETSDSDHGEHQSEAFLGFLDTTATLAMIGTCNLLFGWIIPCILHIAGIQPFVAPDNWMQWVCLNLNAAVEFSFDASCALTIFLTSPIILSIISPLTLPASVLADLLLLSSSEVGFGCATIIGTSLILLGVLLLETSKNTILKWVLFPARLPRRLQRRRRRRRQQQSKNPEAAPLVPNGDSAAQ